jgi:hypothetical protein
MSGADGDGNGTAPGGGWLKAALYVGGGGPVLLGTFFGTILEYLGVPGTNAPGLAYDYWAQVFFFTILAVVAVSGILVSRWLVGRGQHRVGGAFAALVGAGMTPVGFVVLPTLWILAGPLAIVGGGLAFVGGTSSREAEGAAT